MRWIATLAAQMFMLAIGWSLKTPMGRVVTLIELTTPPGEVWVRWRPRGMRADIAERRIHVSAGERREVPFDDE